MIFIIFFVLVFKFYILDLQILLICQKKKREEKIEKEFRIFLKVIEPSSINPNLATTTLNLICNEFFKTFQNKKDKFKTNPKILIMRLNLELNLAACCHPPSIFNNFF
jgi:hypothetical protein